MAIICSIGKRFPNPNLSKNQGDLEVAHFFPRAHESSLHNNSECPPSECSGRYVEPAFPGRPEPIRPSNALERQQSSSFPRV